MKFKNIFESIKLYHVSNPEHRKNIKKEGLVPQIGPSYEAHYEKNMGPAVFVSSKNEYDSTYDDDRYEITLSQDEYDNLEFHIDKEAKDALYTFNTIPVKNIKLIHKGSGDSTF